MLEGIEEARNYTGEAIDDIVEYHIDLIQQLLASDQITPESVPEKLDNLLEDGMITDKEADEIGEAVAPLMQQ